MLAQRKSRRAYAIGILIIAWILAACEPALMAEPSEIPETPDSTPSSVGVISEPTGTPLPQYDIEGDVSIWLSWSPDKVHLLKQMLRDFQVQHPGVKISLSYFPENALQTSFENAAAAGKGPSILIAPSSFGPPLWKAGWLLDLKDRVGDEFREKIHKPAWTQVEFNQSVIGVPIEIKGIVLYRNRHMAPVRAATTDELISGIQSITEGPVLGASLDLGFYFTASQIGACGGSLADYQGRPAFNQPEGICWLELLATLADVSRTTTNTDEDLTLFEEGRSAWLIDGTWNANRLAKAIGDSWLTVDSWPIYGETGKRLAGYVWTDNAYLASDLDDEDLEASWAVVNYLLSPVAQDLAVKTLGARQLPVLKSVQLNDLRLQQIQAVLNAGEPLPIYIDLDLYIRAMEAEIVSAALRGTDPGFSLLRAERRIERNR